MKRRNVETSKRPNGWRGLVARLRRLLPFSRSQAASGLDVSLPWQTRIDNKWKTLKSPWPQDKDYRVFHSPTHGHMLCIRPGAREPTELYHQRMVKLLKHTAGREPGKN